VPLLNLSNEILLQILGQSDILRPRDFCNVACTCKRLSPLTEPLLYREIRDSPDEIWVPRGWKLSSRLAYIIKKFNDNPGRAIWVRSAAFAFDPYRACGRRLSWTFSRNAPPFTHCRCDTVPSMASTMTAQLALKRTSILSTSWTVFLSNT
jgi:hypothetical protein